MMTKDIEDIKKALKCCATNDEMQCWLCPYVHNPDGCLTLPADALEAIEELEKVRDLYCMEASIAHRQKETYLTALVDERHKLKNIKTEAVKEFEEKFIQEDGYNNHNFDDSASILFHDEYIRGRDEKTKEVWKLIKRIKKEMMDEG